MRRPTALATLAAIGAGLLLAAPVRAQGAPAVDATLDLGASRVGYAGGGSLTALSVAPAARWSGRTLDLRGGGSWSAFAGGGWSLQGAATASAYTPASAAGAAAPRWRRLRGEAAATVGGNAQGGGTGGGQALLLARAHAAGAQQGLWVGAGGGSAWESGPSRATGLAELGAWRSAGAADVVAVVTPTRADSARYTDLALAAAWTRGRLSLDAQAGARVAHQAAAGAGWGGAGAAWVVGPRLALVAAAGSYPVDPTQGFPGGRYASLALRARLRAPNAPPPPPPSDPTAAGATPEPAAPATPAAPAAGPVRAFEHAPAPDGRRLVRVHAPGARLVEIAGDFTDWAPVRLTSAGAGWWEASVAVAAGVHQVNVRVNGGAWLVPPGLRARVDEVGGAVGVWLVR